jgi:hypothetical protein
VEQSRAVAFTATLGITARAALPRRAHDRGRAVRRFLHGEGPAGEHRITPGSANYFLDQ